MKKVVKVEALWKKVGSGISMKKASIDSGELYWLGNVLSMEWDMRWS
ncbi:hypothetical protein PTI45_01755 [Paenibacillus nuruki]|uniref:Uncharacterized protein n=1 Tax=Paenibacillus nuruki TaxID=1886670 RepID=A0A1E3L4R8_9BACL|nr:hypothetical protein [Paenibacillus nuruki]ODP28779.1 hypothetical protein PTI45_01755 [Paenibacillus nuruki]